jgi:hypothetical protein
MTKSVGVTALCLMVSSTTVWAGEKYVGLWGGEAPSSIEFVAKKPLVINYCFKGQCSKVKPQGTIEGMTFIFQKNGTFPGATMVMNKVDGKYWGTYVLYGTSDVSVGTFSPEK